jgi:hypothetical protein
VAGCGTTGMSVLVPMTGSKWVGSWCSGSPLVSGAPTAAGVTASKTPLWAPQFVQNLPPLVWTPHWGQKFALSLIGPRNLDR